MTNDDILFAKLCEEQINMKLLQLKEKLINKEYNLGDILCQLDFQ